MAIWLFAEFQSTLRRIDAWKKGCSFFLFLTLLFFSDKSLDLWPATSSEPSPTLPPVSSLTHSAATPEHTIPNVSGQIANPLAILPHARATQLECCQPYAIILPPSLRPAAFSIESFPPFEQSGLLRSCPHGMTKAIFPSLRPPALSLFIIGTSKQPYVRRPAGRLD